MFDGLALYLWCSFPLVAQNAKMNRHVAVCLSCLGSEPARLEKGWFRLQSLGSRNWMAMMLVLHQFMRAFLCVFDGHTDCVIRFHPETSNVKWSKMTLEGTWIWCGASLPCTRSQAEYNGSLLVLWWMATGMEAGVDHWGIRKARVSNCSWFVTKVARFHLDLGMSHVAIFIGDFMGFTIFNSIQ